MTTIISVANTSHFGEGAARNVCISFESANALISFFFIIFQFAIISILRKISLYVKV